MRDDLSAIFLEDGERNPIKSAQREMRRPLPKKFYSAVAVAETPDGFGVTLDGKPVRTPARSPLAAPTKALAEALAQEWSRQGELIDPADMPLTRIVNSGLDGVAREIEQVAAEIAKFAASDLICYRAGAPENLVAEQGAAWDPILAHFRETHAARFICAEGVIFVEQPAESRAIVTALISRQAGRPDGALRLAALHVLTTISGSALIALALVEGAISLDAALAAAHVDEDFETRHWGEDEEAKARRNAREKDFAAAYELWAALG